MLVQAYGFLYGLLNLLIFGSRLVQVKANVHNGSATIDHVSNFAAVEVGSAVTGTGIAALSTIVSFDVGAGTITLNNPATADHLPGTVNITPPGSTPFIECKVHLFQNNHIPSPNDDITSYVEATFDGYAVAPADIQWGAVGVDNNGAPQVFGDLKVFTMSGSTTPNTIYGYYVTDEGGDMLYWAELFANPVNMATVGDQIALVPVYSVGNES